MPLQASDTRDAGTILADLEAWISRLRFTAQVQDLIGRPGKAAESQAEADKLQALLDLLRATVGYEAAWERGAAH